MEPPRGLRANMLRTFTDLPPAFLDPQDQPQHLASTWRGLVFSCAFFHALVQVRVWVV